MAGSVSQTPLYLALQFILKELETSAYFKIKFICDFLAKGCTECLLTPTACLCTAAKYENEPLSHLHSPLNAVLDSKPKLLYIPCMMWTWWWPLKTFNWVAVGAEAIKLRFMKITLTGQNSVVYSCSRILYEWIRKYCQTKWEDQPPAKRKCCFKKRLCCTKLWKG